MTMSNTSDRLSRAVAELVEALAESLRAEAAAVPATPDRLYSIDEAAVMLGIGRSALYGEIRAGRVRSIKVGRRRLIPSGAISERIAAA